MVASFLRNAVDSNKVSLNCNCKFSVQGYQVGGDGVSIRVPAQGAKSDSDVILISSEPINVKSVKKRLTAKVDDEKGERGRSAEVRLQTDIPVSSAASGLNTQKTKQNSSSVISLRSNKQLKAIKSFCICDNALTLDKVAIY